MNKLDVTSCENGKISFEQSVGTIKLVVKPSLKWTKDAPTKEGNYWYRTEFDGLIVMLYVNGYDDRLYVDDGEETTELDFYKGEWYGPIEPPEYF